MTLEEFLRKRLDGSRDACLEVDVWLDDNGNIHMSIVGRPDEDWPVFTVTGNELKGDEDDGTNVRN